MDDIHLVKQCTQETAGTIFSNSIPNRYIEGSTGTFDGSSPVLNNGEGDEFCLSVLSRFSSSDKEDSQSICRVIGTMSQEIKEKNLAPTFIVYFGATCSSLDIFSTEDESPTYVFDALLSILSMLINKVSMKILKKKREYLSELLVRVMSIKTLSASGAASGCKCISQVIIAADKVNWSDVSQLYGFLLGFATHSHPKVRRHSHMCLKDILQNFQGTLLLAPASEGVTKIFERLLLLAGGSNETAFEGPKCAQEILYLLDAFKECLPLIPMRLTFNTLKYYKTLLDLHQPIVTMRIKDSLYALCVHQASEFPPEILLDLLCFLALSISGNETSASSMTSTVRLLDVGVKKVWFIRREICVVKLPLLFSALKDIFLSEHAEAVFAAMEALKNLTDSCIDEELIKQGVEQIILSSNLNTRKSGPTIIEKLCAHITSLLDYPFIAVWDSSFQVVSVFFEKLGKDSSYLLRETLKNMSDMQSLPEEDFPYRKQLHECIGTALSAMGPEQFLSIVPLKLDANEISEVNVWLFPILKQYTMGAHLSFFQNTILKMVELIREKSQCFQRDGQIFSSRSTEALVYSLWSLFPSFCNYPKDTAGSFSKLGKVLSSALQQEPDVIGIICSGIMTLIQQNKKFSDPIDLDAVEGPRRRAMACYTPELVTQNLRALKDSGTEMLPVLSKVFLKSTKDSGGCLQATIREFASISDKTVVAFFFRKTLDKFLSIDESFARAQLIDLAVSLLPGLCNEEINALLFKFVKPSLKDLDGVIQKKAYKVLSMILKDCDCFQSTKLDELRKLIIDVLPSCHFSARRHRLDCLYFLIVHISKDDSKKMQSNIISFLTEIILALKEANKKTRNRAYDLLVHIGHAYGDEEKGGTKEGLYHYFHTVAKGLVGDQPQMISAAVTGIARLAYEFTDLISEAYNFLPSTFLLLQSRNKEIIKANLGFLKVLVVNSQAEGLQAQLMGLVGGLMKLQNNTKNQFQAKVKFLLAMLVKKCGLEAVKAVMPDAHMKLLTNIRKAITRKEKKSTAGSEEARSIHTKATTSRFSRWNHTKVFSDFNDEESDDEQMGTNSMSTLGSTRPSKFNSKSSSRSKGIPKATKSLAGDEFEDEPLDLLDRRKTRSSLRSDHPTKRKPERTDEAELDSEGRLVIREEAPKKRRVEYSADCMSRVSVDSDRRRIKKKTESGQGYAGSEYGSKKAGGDVKRKGRVEPYAYWPLDRKMMSRRREHRAAARRGMSLTVARMAKKLEGKSGAVALSAAGGIRKKWNKKGKRNMI